MNEFERQVPIEYLPDLPPTDIEIRNLNLLSLGYDWAGSAAKRGISRSCVKKESYKLFRKLGATNITHAVRLGIELGYVDVGKVNKDDYKPLSQKEFLAVELASFGFTVEESALARGISYKTLKNQRRIALKKLKALNITHATRRCFELEIFHFPISENHYSAVQIGALLLEHELALSTSA